MSTRTRTYLGPYIPKVDTSTQLVAGGALSQVSSTSWGLFYEKNHSMTDDPVVNKRFYFKDCLHTRSGTVLCPPDRIWIAIPALSGYSGCYASSKQHQWKLGTPVFGGPSVLPTLANIGSSSMAARALRTMLPTVNEGVSLVNFVLELKDFRRIVHTVSKKSTSILKKDGKWVHTPFSWRDKLKDLLWDPKLGLKKNLAKNILQYSFGWAPLYSDLKEIWKALTTLKKKLAWLRSHSDKVLKRQYRRVLPGYTDYVTEQQSVFLNQIVQGCAYNASFVANRKVDTTWIQKPTYCATMIYRFKLPKVSQAEQELEAFMDVLGIGKLDPSILWNAIPFSFLVDWIVDVGAWLRNFKPADLGIETEVIEFCHSVKYSQLCESKVSTYNGAQGRMMPFLTTASTYRTRFERLRAYPNLWTLNVSDFSFKKAVLAWSLVEANRKTNRRRPSQIRSTGQINDTDP